MPLSVERKGSYYPLAPFHSKLKYLQCAEFSSFPKSLFQPRKDSHTPIICVAHQVSQSSINVLPRPSIYIPPDVDLDPADPVLPTLNVLLLSVSQAKAGNSTRHALSGSILRWMLDRPLYMWVWSPLNFLFHSQTSLLNISWGWNLCSTKPSHERPYLL